MEDIHSKTELLERVRSARQAFQQVLSRVDPLRMSEPGVDGDWSIKDTLAHIVAWEEKMRAWLGESLRGETPQRPAPGMTWDDLDELNRQIFEAQRHRPLEAVRADFESSYRQALSAVEAVPEADLLEADRFPWRRGNPLWQMVAANTFWHYDEHREIIERWLEESGNGD